MTRRFWWIAAVLAAMVAVTGGALGSSASTGRATKLRLLDVSDKFEFVDVGRPATGEGDFSPGDMLIFENILRNARGGKDVGNFFANWIATRWHVDRQSSVRKSPKASAS